MGLSRRRKRDQPTASLTASGQWMDLSDRTLAQRVNRQRAPWQQMAWNYRELIGELGSGIEYEANILSKVHFLPAAVSNEDEPSLPGSDQWRQLPQHVARAAQEALDILPFRNGYAFTGVLSTCLRVAGEAWLHGFTDKGRERWAVRSSDEVVTVSNGLGIVDAPGLPPRPVDPKGDEVLLRLWKPHPRWSSLADSPLRRMLDTCEDIVLIGRELRAAARSRVASNGILLIPNGMEIVRKPDGSGNDFQTELELTMLAPISNEGDAGAVVPVVLKGPVEALKEVRHIVLARETSEDLIEKLEATLRRLREGMDMPPDANQSVKDMNHWSAWSVSQENWKNYLEPHTRLVDDSLTEAYLRPSLVLPESGGGWGLTEEEAELVQVWHDAGNVTENANRGKDALDLFDRGEIGGMALRSAKGFGEDDAPDEAELQRMLAWQATKNMTPELAQGLLGEFLRGMGIGGVTTVVPGTASRTLPNRGAIEVSPRRPTSGTPGTQPSEPTPADGPPVVASAAKSDKRIRPQKCKYGPEPAVESIVWAEGMAYVPVCKRHEAQAIEKIGGRSEVDKILPIGDGSALGVLDSVRLIDAERLAEIERALRDRLMVAADAEMVRVLERAGSRVRGALQQRDKALAADVKGLAAEDVCELVGAERIGELGIGEDTLLGQAFTRLAKKWTAWTTAAVRDTTRAVADMLGLSLVDTSALSRTLSERIPTAWKGLESTLRRRALDKLYGRKGDELRGEVPDTLVRPGDIRAALAEIGGLPPGGVEDGKVTRPGEVLGGLALGRDIVNLIDDRASRVGFVWKYGITPRERAFEPHRKLNGRRFTDWQDEALTPPPEHAWIGTRMAPGDHSGCMCDYVPTWAVLPTMGQIATEIEPETANMINERTLAGLDDAAGRKGTTAQRTRDERERILAVQREWMELA